MTFRRARGKEQFEIRPEAEAGHPVVPRRAETSGTFL